MSLERPTQRIVCATDFSASAGSALAWAEALAEADGAELHVVHVWQMPAVLTPTGVPIGIGDLGSRIETEMSASLATACEGRRVAKRWIRQGLPDVEIAALAEELGADLIVVGTHGRSGLAHVLLGSVAERVVRLAPCPVVTIPGGARVSPERLVRTILAPTDLTGGSEAAIARILGMAERLDAEVALLHVLDLPVYALREADVVTDVEASAKRDLAELAERHRTKANRISTHVRVGAAAEVIAAVGAELGVDLVALPTHARHGMARFFLGSVAERVARTAGRPVLTLKGAS